MRNDHTVHFDHDERTYKVARRGKMVASGLSNSRAWALADKLNMEPSTRQHDVTDWKSRANDR